MVFGNFDIVSENTVFPGTWRLLERREVEGQLEA